MAIVAPRASMPFHGSIVVDAATSPSNVQFYAPVPRAVETVTAVKSQAGGGTYYYWVLANCPGGSILPTRYAEVAGAALGSGGSVAVGWEPVPGATSYTVVRTDVPRFDPAAMPTIAQNVSGTTVVDTGILPVVVGVALKPPAEGIVELDNSEATPQFVVMPGVTVYGKIETTGPNGGFVFPDGTTQTTASTGGGAAAQTPWVGDIDAAGNDISNVGTVEAHTYVVLPGTGSDPASTGSIQLINNELTIVSSGPSADILLSATDDFTIMTANQDRLVVDGSGRVLIGPVVDDGTSLLQVAGPIRSSEGGFVFPDGTVQTTAAASPVTSVFGRTGAIVAQAGDYDASQVTNAVSTMVVYADPPWISALSWSKIQGAPSQAFYQTPWLSHINGAGYQLQNAGQIQCSPSIEVGSGTLAFIDWHGQDGNFPDYSFRIIGTTNTELVHRGTGDFIHNSIEGGNVTFVLSAVERARINAVGLGIGMVAGVPLSVRASTNGVDTVRVYNVEQNKWVGIVPEREAGIGDIFYWNAGSYGTLITNSPFQTRAHYTAFSNLAGAGFPQAAIEVRESSYAPGYAQNNSYAPRIAFHWSGLVASQIRMHTDGSIAVVNNPGDNYERFQAGQIDTWGLAYLHGPMTQEHSTGGTTYALSNTWSAGYGMTITHRGDGDAFSIWSSNRDTAALTNCFRVGRDFHTNIAYGNLYLQNHIYCNGYVHSAILYMSAAPDFSIPDVVYISPAGDNYLHKVYITQLSTYLTPKWSNIQEKPDVFYMYYNNGADARFDCRVSAPTYMSTIGGIVLKNWAIDQLGNDLRFWASSQETFRFNDWTIGNRAWRLRFMGPMNTTLYAGESAAVTAGLLRGDIYVSADGLVHMKL